MFYVKTYIRTYIATIKIQMPAYIGLCVDVGSSMAKQSRHLGVTLISRYGQGGDPTLSERGTYSTMR